MSIYNFSLHRLENEQKLDGIKELSKWKREIIKGVLTFPFPPNTEQMRERAEALVTMALDEGAERVMISPASFFASTLEEEFEKNGIMTVYPYSSHTGYNTKSKEGFIRRSGAFEYVGLVEGNFETAHEVWDHEPASDRILNLTRISALPEQAEAGVIEPDDKEGIISALTFLTKPTRHAIRTAAELLADIAMKSGCSKAMINGVPYFMRALENSLIARNITPVYSFTDRRTGEYRDEDGAIRKMYDLKHLGFVEIDKTAKREAWKKEQEKISLSSDDVRVNIDEGIDTSDIDKGLEDILSDLMGSM